MTIKWFKRALMTTNHIHDDFMKIISFLIFLPYVKRTMMQSLKAITRLSLRTEQVTLVFV